MSKSQRDPTPTNVSEISAADLLSECRSGKDVLLLDCREPYEWYQVRIPGSLHIPITTSLSGFQNYPQTVKSLWSALTASALTLLLVFCCEVAFVRKAYRAGLRCGRCTVAK
jgi:hypothetical protein